MVVMDNASENGEELYTQDGVIVKATSSNKASSTDLLNNSGSLSIVEYTSDLEKCIEWNQCDVSIEIHDQEWAIVHESKCQIGCSSGNSKNSKNPNIRIPLKNINSFKISKDNLQISFNKTGDLDLVEFYFQRGKVKLFLEHLTCYLNTSVSKKDVNLYIVKDGMEVKALEKSFAELDLFSDEDSKTDAMWSFIKKLHDRPYETTMSAFSKVTDAFLYKTQQPEINVAADLLSISPTCDGLADFHGRISDYEFISKWPPLPPRTLPPRGSPLTRESFSAFFSEDGRILEENIVKQIIFNGGISPITELRSEAWKFLLEYYPWNSTYEEREQIKMQKKEEYITMKLQWKSMTLGQENNFAAYKERKSLIEKDVFRTDRNMPFFAGENNKNLEKLQNILMTYIMYNFDLGYVQGMSDLLSPLLVQLQDEVDTFWCFVGFMNKMHRNFDMDQAGMKEQLNQLYCLLRYIEPNLASYLESQDSHGMSFCFRWLLIWFKREFSCEEIFKLWEILWTESLCKNFHLLICAAILDTEKERIINNNYGLTEILKHINDLANHMDLDLMLRKAVGIYNQLSNAAKIPPSISEIIGLEPVHKCDSPDQENNSSDKFSGNNCTSHNGIDSQDMASLGVEANEMAFDTSISLQYL